MSIFAPEIWKAAHGVAAEEIQRLFMTSKPSLAATLANFAIDCQVKQFPNDGKVHKQLRLDSDTTNIIELPAEHRGVPLAFPRAKHQ